MAESRNFLTFFFVNRTPVGYSSFAEKLFSRRYSNFKFKFFYSIVVLYSVILRGVAMFWHIVHIYLKKLIFSFKARRGLQRKAGKTPHSVSLDWVRLCTVLVTFGFLENLISWLRAVLACAESDCSSVSHFWIFEKFNFLTSRSVSLCGVGLRTVLVSFGFSKNVLKYFEKISTWTLDSLEMEIFESKQIV